MKDRLTAYWDRMRKGQGHGQGREKAAPVDPGDFVGRDAGANEQVVRERFAAKAKRHLNRLPLAHETASMYFCVLDAKTPLWVKATAAAALAYFILPLDALPDILPVVGLSDDAGVLAAALSAVSAHVTGAHRDRARAWMDDENLGNAPAAGAKPAV